MGREDLHRYLRPSQCLLEPNPEAVLPISTRGQLNLGTWLILFPLRIYLRFCGKIARKYLHPKRSLRCQGPSCPLQNSTRPLKGGDGERDWTAVKTCQHPIANKSQISIHRFRLPALIVSRTTCVDVHALGGVKA